MKYKSSMITMVYELSKFSLWILISVQNEHLILESAQNIHLHEILTLDYKICIALDWLDKSNTDRGTVNSCPAHILNTSKMSKVT